LHGELWPWLMKVDLQIAQLFWQDPCLLYSPSLVLFISMTQSKEIIHFLGLLALSTSVNHILLSNRWRLSLSISPLFFFFAVWRVCLLSLTAALCVAQIKEKVDVLLLLRLISTTTKKLGDSCRECVIYHRQQQQQGSQNTNYNRNDYKSSRNGDEKWLLNCSRNLFR
jgi:hypothetical protein